MSAASLGHVWLVGAGPGNPDYITVAGMNALRRAEVVVYDRLSAPELLAYAPDDALLIDAGKAADNHTLTQDEINALLLGHGRGGKRVVRLKGGDPYVFGRGGEEAVVLADAGVPCTVIPGVTSAIGGLAAGGVPVTHRAVATSFAVITGHEDPTKPEAGVHWDRLATAVDTLVILMGVGRLDGIARALIEGGRDASTPAALVQEASTPRQRVVTGTLATIADVARDVGIEAPALFVVGDVAALQSTLDPRRLAPLAGKRVLVTRSRAQSSTLVDALRAEGAWPIVLPALEMERRVDATAVRDARAKLEAGEYNWTIFTSSNAVDTFLDELWGVGGDLRALTGVSIAAIGPGTAQALVRRGLRADIIAEDAIGEGLLALLAENRMIEGWRVLLPRAEGARDVLPEGLRAAGVILDELTLYLAAPPAEAPPEALAAIRNGEIDVVTFASSSTVRNLATLLGGDLSALASATVACIGPIAAQTAREYGLEPHVVAEVHTIDGMVAALRAHLHSLPEASPGTR